MTHCDVLQVLPRLPFVLFCAGTQRDVRLQPGEEEETLSEPEKGKTPEVDLGDWLQAILHVSDGAHREEDREEEEEVFPPERRDPPEQDGSPLPGHLSATDPDHGHLQRQLAWSSALRVPHGKLKCPASSHNY